jgi:hypothetical protein
MSRREQIELNGIEQCKENPIVKTIDKNSFERHGFPAEDMNICGFVLSLEIVENAHDQSDGLDRCVLLPFSEQVEQRQNDDGS